MPRSISLVLPYPPSVNNWTRAFQRPGSSFPVQILTAEARAYKDAVSSMLRAKSLEPLYGTVFIELEVFRPRDQGDIDGVEKILFDALKGIVFGDDAVIIGMRVDRRQEVGLGRVQLVAMERDVENSVLWRMTPEEDEMFQVAQRAHLDARRKARERSNAKKQRKPNVPKQIGMLPAFTKFESKRG